MAASRPPRFPDDRIVTGPRRLELRPFGGSHPARQALRRGLSPVAEPADPETLAHRESIMGPDGRPLRPARVRAVVAWTLTVAVAVTALVWVVA